MLYEFRRSTNAAVESLNSKMKGFRTQVRGVPHLPFFNVPFTYGFRLRNAQNYPRIIAGELKLILLLTYQGNAILGEEAEFILNMEDDYFKSDKHEDGLLKSDDNPAILIRKLKLC